MNTTTINHNKTKDNNCDDIHNINNNINNNKSNEKRNNNNIHNNISDNNYNKNVDFSSGLNDTFS